MTTTISLVARTWPGYCCDAPDIQSPPWINTWTGYNDPRACHVICNIPNDFKKYDFYSVRSQLQSFGLIINAYIGSKYVHVQAVFWDIFLWKGRDIFPDLLDTLGTGWTEVCSIPCLTIFIIWKLPSWPSRILIRNLEYWNERFWHQLFTVFLNSLVMWMYTTLNLTYWKPVLSNRWFCIGYTQENVDSSCVPPVIF